MYYDVTSIKNVLLVADVLLHDKVTVQAFSVISSENLIVKNFEVRLFLFLFRTFANSVHEPESTLLF